MTPARLLFAIIVAASASVAVAEVRLHPLFPDPAVLQRTVAVKTVN